MKYLCILIFVFVSACKNANIPESVVFDNNRLAKISIDAEILKINKIYKSIYSEPYIDHSLLNPPIQRLERWIEDNISIFGLENKLEINILDASIKQTEIQNENSKQFEGNKIFKYELFYLVEYNLLSNADYLIATTTVESKRTTTSGKYISIIEKEKIIDKLIWESLEAISNQSNVLLKKYMQDYIL